MSARAGLRFFAQSSRQSAVRSPFQTRQSIFRRFQTSAANASTDAQPSQSLLQRLWTSEVGIKTVHFWAPVMKWGVVLAGASDFLRPAEKLSLTQNLALTATGSIWTRWCLIIKPRNVLLAAVNFALAIVGVIQVGRIFAYHVSQTGSVKGAFKELANDIKNSEKKAEKEPA